jgi:hypothetical protein
VIVIPTLYELAPKDIATGAAPQRWARRLVVTSAAVTHQFRPLLGIPRDRVALVTAFTIDARGGAAQPPRTYSVQLEDETLNALVEPYRDYYAGSDLLRSVNHNFSIPAIVMPLESVVMEATYSAGAVNNTTVFNIIGMIVPRGNWQLA